MRVIPAIDLKDGQCVRLQKGDYGTAHKVAENPVETAQRFLDAGADLVHMVDLDAAKDGSHANYGVVEQVIRETGIRSRGGQEVRRQDRCRHRCQERDRPHGRLAGRQR